MVEPPSDAGSDAGGVAACVTQSDCDDHMFCNGVERCDATASGADARGCVHAAAPCSSGMVCQESTDTCVGCGTTRDGDGDGVDSVACGGTDCDDNDPNRLPGNTETCDTMNHDEDCDPTTVGQRDLDGDGETSSTCCNPASGSAAPVCGTDCNDTSIAQRSGQVEFCDTIDNDCDTVVDEMTAAVDWYPDADGDGFGAVGGTPTNSCAPVANSSLLATDCDDTNSHISRVAPEVCDGVDQDCNGLVDDGLTGCVTPMDAGMPGDGSVSTDDAAASIDAALPPTDSGPPSADSGPPVFDDAFSGPDDAGFASMCTLPMTGPYSGGSFVVNADGSCQFTSGTGLFDWSWEPGMVGVAAYPYVGSPDGRIVSVTQAVPLTSSGRLAVRSDVDVTLRVEVSGVVYDLVIRISSSSITISSLSVCDPAGAPMPYYQDIDGDGAGAGAAAGSAVCAPPVGYSFRGDDCDEFADDNSPAFIELCNGNDNDCSGVADDASPSVMCPGRPNTIMACTSGVCGVGGCVATYSSCEGASDPSGDGCETETGGTNALDCGGCDLQCAGTCAGGTCTLADGAWVSVEGEPQYGACAVRTTGAVACWGYSVPLGSFGSTTVDVPFPVPGMAGIVQVAHGYDHVCGRRADGHVLCWGGGEPAGAPSGTRFDVATEIASITDAVEIAAGANTTCVRRSGGGILCWGRDVLGRTGATATEVPTAVTGIVDAVSIDVTAANACVARTGGGVLCWGHNTSGQVGDGTTTNHDTPRTVSGVTGATRVFLGDAYACAIRAGGALSCWGADDNGQLGDVGAAGAISGPVTVPGLANVTDVATNQSAACARLSSGATYCWGGSGFGGSAGPTLMGSLGSNDQITGDRSYVYGRTGATIRVWRVQMSAGASTVYPGGAGDGALDDGIVRSGPSGYCLFGLDACAASSEVCYRWSGSLSCMTPPTVTETSDRPDTAGAVTTWSSTPIVASGAISTAGMDSGIFDTDCYGITVAAGGSLVARALTPCDPSGGGVFGVNPMQLAVYNGAGTLQGSYTCSMATPLTGLTAGNYAVCISYGEMPAYQVAVGASLP